MAEPEEQLAAFWLLGPLPEAGAGRVDPRPAPDLLGRPEITVDGRNLGDVLAAAYRALVEE